jgi:hypothetical protein
MVKNMLRTNPRLAQTVNGATGFAYYSCFISRFISRFIAGQFGLAMGMPAPMDLRDLRDHLDQLQGGF